ncbi:MAG: PorV/PorQ family protein [Candidatus Zixiibacteriota bacterium]|nr:MAG: PorV/PorQ family protein [candidate division Zixibacteria bacterium]
MRVLTAILGIFTLFYATADGLAQGTGSAAMEFLNIGVSAKSSATGGAFSAIADGPVSSFYNPAGLASIENYQVAGMHTEWYQDLKYEYLGCGIPVGRSGGFGVSFSYLSYGSIKSYSETGVPTGDIQAYDMALNLSYGHRIKDRLLMGFGIKGVAEKLADISVKGFAADFGMQYKAYKYMLGFSVMNFGPNLKYETVSSPLPTTINAGASYKPFGPEFSLMMGGSMPFHGDFSFKTGIEYSYNDIFMLRGGYDTRKDYDGKSGIALGAGINVSNHNLDYAYNINDIMGGTHQISFVFKFGNSRKSGDKVDPMPIKLNSMPVQETYTGLSNDISKQGLDSTDGNDISVQETYTESSENESGNNAKKYQICAARYQNEESARKHISTLKKFGVNSWLFYDGSKEYRVVLGETDKLSKAEKMKSKFDKEGVFCFIQEM